MTKHAQSGARIGGLTLLLMTANLSGATAQRCDADAAGLVARAYYLSMPLLGDDRGLERLLNSNAQTFSVNGAATQCMRALGSALVTRSLVRAPEEKRDAAQEAFGGQMPEGLEHLPGEVDASMRSATTEYFTMGQELLWLSRVLPQALQGNAGPYNAQDTQMRQTMAQVAPQLRMMCSMDGSICATFFEAMTSLGPMVEQQIVQLATGP